MSAIVLHVDLDSFYASVEKQRRPELANVPIVICMITTRGGGAVATASYEARSLGIHAGLSIGEARRLATSETVFVPADRPHYQRVSEQIMATLRSRADAFQQVSIDETALDVSQRCRSMDEAARLAQDIKDQVKKQFGLTSSIGIGPNKLVAKIAAGMKKPDGLTVVRENEITQFLDTLPLRKLHGVGPETRAVLEQHGISTVTQLRHADQQWLQKTFGAKRGLLLYEKAAGIDPSPVVEQERKQLSRISTLPYDSADIDAVMTAVHEMLADLDGKIQEKGVAFRTISIIAIQRNLEMHTKSTTLEEPATSVVALEPQFRSLFTAFLREHPTALRRCGVSVSSFMHGPTPKRAQRRLGDF